MTEIPTIDVLMKKTTLAEMPVMHALQFLATIINAASDQRRADAATHAIELSKTVVPIGQYEKSVRNYFVANAWHAISVSTGRAQRPDFSHAELGHEVFHLRLAIQDCPHEQKKLRCQILTNLGNSLSQIGRIVEALAYWQRALDEDPTFGMALGNRGIGRWTYARALYDEGHKHILASFAHQDLVNAETLALEQDASESIIDYRREIEGCASLEFLDDHRHLRDYSMGNSIEEIEYRRWCLAEGLFLNPINDLGPYSIAARDVLLTPDMSVDCRLGPAFQGFYNQLKQEFTSARFLLYSYYSMISKQNAQHYSDDGILLLDTLDHPIYSLASEKARIAFRVFYAIFDKIAFFLNSYLILGISERDVSFRKLWYIKGDAKKGLRPNFLELINWPLRGLYWLSKDLYENDQDLLDSLEPDARETNEIRNYLEHKYLKLHEDNWQPDANSHIKDALAYSIKKSDFLAKTKRLAVTTRAALIYLSLALHNEERQRLEARGNVKTLSITLPLLNEER